MTYTKASPEAHQSLAKKYAIQGVSPEDVLKDLKRRSYVINNSTYNAARVAAAVAMFHDINNAVKSGSLKASKRNGIEIPTITKE